MGKVDVDVEIGKDIKNDEVEISMDIVDDEVVF